MGSKFGFAGLPAYEGGSPIDEIFNCGGALADDTDSATPEDAYMQIVRDTSEDEFLAYCRRLESEGFTAVYDRGNSAGLYRQYERGGRLVYTYYIYAERTTRIISEGRTCTVVEFSGGGENTLGDTALMQFSLYYSDMIHGTTCDCGMMYVLRLRNNELIIVDGGEYEQSTEEAVNEFMERIHALTGTPKGGRITIAAWYCTHDHNDHMDFFSKLIRFRSDELELKRVMFNLPSARLQPHSDPCTARMRSRISKAYPNVKFLKLHTGQRFTLGNAAVEVLVTHEDILPRHLAEGMYYDGVNETSTILKIEFEGQSILFLADAIDTVGEIFRERFGGVGLECTYLQAAHHCINRVEDIYNSVKAKAILIPQCRYIAESRHYDNYRLICDCYGAENTFFAGDCTRICFTDGQTSRVEYYPTVGGKYDNSEY